MDDYVLMKEKCAEKVVEYIPLFASHQKIDSVRIKEISLSSGH